MDKTKVKLGEEFRAAPAYRTYYYINLMVVLLLFFFSWYIPLIVLAPMEVTTIISLFLGIPVLLITLLTLYWIPKYYDTLLYKLTENEMVWRRGVWFRKTGIVPYNRITNIDIEQGPLSRSLGIGSLKIQTAGYSGAGGGTGHPAEIRIEGVVHFEELRQFIMGFVHGRKQVGTTGTFESHQDSVLGELVKIRKLLEKRK
ncbi:MAG: PH domain-containing protein [Candidatus Aenigmarchaeota archaeon]|nr:PH domain-containing protein [Candidatus Aenigmarchaeota archaeon]